METTNAIQQIYIGLLGRAADQEGLQYWTDEIEAGTLTLEQLRANIVEEQPEYEATFGGQTRAQVVSQLYANLFNRAPDDEGLQYWVNGEGASVNIDQLVLALVNGAAAADTLVLDNRTEVANYYTEELGAEGSFDAELAGAVIADVDGTRASVTQAKASVDNGDITAPTPNEGNTFTLTENGGQLEGTNANDEFFATSTGTNARIDGAVLDGKGGNDTLYFTNTSNAAGAPGAIRNIENVYVQTTQAGGNLNAQNISGMEALWDNGSTAASSVTNIQNAVALGLNGATAGTTLTRSFVDGTYSSGAEVNVALSGTNGASGAGNRATLDARHAGTANAATNGVLNVAATANSSSWVDVDVTAGNNLVTAFNTVNVTGAGNVNLTSGGFTAATRTYDASEATGNVSLTAGAFNATNNAVSVLGGSGDDTFNLTAATLGSNLTVNGGEGSDTVVVAGTNNGAVDLTGTFTSVEKLSIAAVTNAANTNAATVNASAVGGGQNITIQGYDDSGAAMGAGESATLTINNLANNATVAFTGDVDGAAASNGVTTALNLGASAKTADNPTMDLVLGSSSAGVTIEDLNVDGAVETLSITSQGGANTITDLASGGLKALTLTGDENISITAPTLGANNSVALSSVDLSGMEAGTTITFNMDGNDRGASVITTFQMGEGIAALTLDASDGNADVIKFTDASQSTALATDTVNNFVVADDLIDISEFVEGNFSWVGNTAFSSNEGNTQARWSDANTLQIDVNGDATADMVITLAGGVADDLTAANFTIA